MGKVKGAAPVAAGELEEAMRGLRWSRGPSVNSEGPAESGCRYPAAAYPGNAPYAPQFPRHPQELHTHMEEL